MQLAPGSVLGAYRIVRPLGGGGMGCVFEAEHIELRARRALKVFAADSEHGDFLRKRFVAEGRLLADLRHPRIVRVYDFAIDEATGTPYFAMDLIVSPTGEPRTLEDACRDGVEESQVADWYRDICAGLGYIHRQGVVHRDISLDNVMIDGNGRAVLTDFGIAKITADTYRRKIDVTVTMAALAGEKIRLGKGLYMAPELRNGGEATPASDAYAVGVLLFRLLTGSWLTTETRLEDALAGMDYNWPTVIGRLCVRSASARMGPDGMPGVCSLLRRRDTAHLSRRVGLRTLTVSLLVVLAGLVFAMVRMKSGTPETGEPTRPESTVGAAGEREATNISPAEKTAQAVYRIVDVTNVIKQTVYEIVTFTNVVDRPAESQE